jgi:ATP-dependent DNA ligase
MARKSVKTWAAMEARAVDRIPEGDVWQYEPKWDGFRCLIDREGQRVTMLSKAGQDLARYFPEIAAAASRLHVSRFMLDGELIVPAGSVSSFDALLQRIHSRVEPDSETRERNAGDISCLRYFA